MNNFFLINKGNAISTILFYIQPLGKKQQQTKQKQKPKQLKTK